MTRGQAPTGQALPPVPWPRRWTPPQRSRFPLIAGWVILALAVVALVNPAALEAAADEPVGVLGRVLGAVMVAGFGTAIILGFAGQRSPVEPPRLINAVTLTRAQRALPDDWVHFFPERRRGATMVAGFAVLAVLLLGIAIAAALVIVPDAARGIEARTMAAVLLGVLGLVGVFFGWAAIRVAIGRVRAGSFGQRGIGIAIGRDAIIVIGVEAVVVIPWTAIRRVEADVIRFGARQRGILGGRARDDSELATIVLHLDPAAVDAELATVTVDVAPGDPAYTISAESSEVHPWVLWAALSFFADPARRETLGTTFAQRELAAWTAGVAAVDRARRR